MSIEAIDTIEQARATTLHWDLRTVRVMRLAIGATVAMTIAQMGSWPLSFAAPAVAVALLEMPINRPGNRDFLINLGTAIASVVLIYIAIVLVQPHPRAFIPLYALTVFWVAYALQKGAPLVPILLTFLGILILPIVGVVDKGLTFIAGSYFLLSLVVGLVVVQMTFALLPDPPGTEQPKTAAYYPGFYQPAARAALATTLVIVPAMAAFLTFTWASQLVVMLYIGLICLEGNRAHSTYDVKKYLTANSVAGLTALIVYFILVAVPQIYFLVPVIMLVSLLFASYRFSDRPGAAYFGSALIGFLILISSSLGAGADIDSNIFLRVFYVFLGGIYVLGVMSILQPGADADGAAHH
jgi:hypothetical protein